MDTSTTARSPGAARRLAESDAGLVGALVVVALVCHGATLANEFVWDDSDIIVARVDSRKTLDGALRSLSSRDFVEETTASAYYRPATSANFIADAVLFDRVALAYHAESIAWHALVVALVFLLMVATGASRPAAWFAAALFAAHPATVEAVAFASARNNLLCGAGMLLALAVLRRPGSPTRWLAFGGASLLAVGSKEPGLVLVGIVAWLAWARLPGIRATRTAVALSAVAAIAYLAARRLVLGESLPLGLVTLDGSHIRLIAGSVVQHLKLMVAPVGLNAWWRVSASDFGWVNVPLALGTGVALTTLSLGTRAPPTVRLGATWLLLSLVPISNIIPIRSAYVAERYLYLPLIGLAMLSAGLLEAGAKRRPRTTWVVATVLLYLLAGRTVLRTLDWRDDVALFSSVIEADPGHASAHYNLGGTLAGLGRNREAAAQFERTIRLNPRHTKAHFMLGSIHLDAGHWSRALAAFDATLSLDPTGYDEALFGRAYALEELGRTAQAAIGYRAYVAAAEKNPRGASDELLSRARAKIAALEDDQR